MGYAQAKSKYGFWYASGTMSTLKRQLLELSEPEFEALVYRFLLGKYPGIDIKKVDGTGGDQGIDCFSGQLLNRPTVWQCKRFVERLRKSQKKQILRSIQTALKARQLGRWVLVLPIDLRTPEHEWFEKEVAKKYEKQCKVELIQGSQILEELERNQLLRDALFPETHLSNVRKLLEIATNSRGLPIRDRATLAAEHSRLFAGDLRNLDPRLEPVISVGSRCAPRAEFGPHRPVFSASNGDLAVDFFVRDAKSYQLDPISIRMTLDKAASGSLLHAVDTGAPIALPPGSLLKLETSSPLLTHFFQGLDPTGISAQIRPLQPPDSSQNDIPLRLVTGKSPEVEEFPCVLFKRIRMGRRETTFESSSSLPIKITLKMEHASNTPITISLSPKLEGASAVSLERVLRFFDSLEKSQRLEIFSLDPPRPLIETAQNISDSLDISPWIKQMVRDAALVSKAFNVDLRIPNHVPKVDLENLKTLTQIATGEPFSVANISASLVKDSKNREAVESFLRGESMTLRIESQENWQRISVFGAQIDSGPVIFIAEDVVANDGANVLRDFDLVAEGAIVRWSGTVRGKCRFVRGDPTHNEQSEIPLGPVNVERSS